MLWCEFELRSEFVDDGECDGDEFECVEYVGECGRWVRARV